MTQPRDNFVFFWGGYLSNWYPCNFKIEGIEYNCGEQWMMAEKARVFEDEVTLKKILTCHLPDAIKKLGRQVTPYSDDKWHLVAKERLEIGLIAKFRQNSDLKMKLLNTGDKKIVEASPYDVIWGIGLSSNDPRCCDPDLWRGKNWLGEVLMKVRDTVRKD